MVKFLSPSLFCYEGFLSVRELNFSKNFMNERRRIASVTESLLKISFVCAGFFFLIIINFTFDSTR